MSYTTLSLNRPIPRIERRFSAPDAAIAGGGRELDRQLLIVSLAANIIYLIAIPSLAVRVIALCGCLTAAALAASASTASPNAARSGSMLPAAWFALPLLSLLASPSIVFWRLDARAWLVLAWLGVLSIPLGGIPAGHAREHRKRAVRLGIFAAWAGLFWLMLLWDLGVGRVVLNLAREERVLWTARIWDTEAIRDHLFLVWLSNQAFAAREAYTNHPLPFALLLYATTKGPQIIAGLPLQVGRNLIPFVLIAPAVLAAGAAAVRAAGPAPIGRTFYTVLFLGVGMVVSEWHFWNAIRFNFDNVFPLIASLTALVWAAARRGASRDGGRMLMLGSVGLALFGWIYTPLVILALWCCFGRRRATLPQTIAANHALARTTLTCLAVAVVVVLIPVALVAIRGYASTASSFLFRSGLDGDTLYFRDVAQAFFAPIAGGPRGWWSLLFPAFAPMAAAVAMGWPWPRPARYRMVVQLLFLLTPFLFSLAIFPQSVSIHPYLYDQLLFLPVVLVGATWWLDRRLQRRLAGARLLGAIILAVAILMANFIAVAQVMRSLLPT